MSNARRVHLVSNRLQYVAIHMGLWLVVCVAGLLILAMMARTGRARLEHAEAVNAIAAAREQFHTGDSAAAQLDLINVLRYHPHAAGTMMEILGTDLLGMPRVLERLAETRPHGASTAEQIRLALLTGDTAQAESLLAEAHEAGDLPRDGYLWWARLELDTGDIDDAAVHFARYWEGRHQQRTALADEITGDDSREAHRAETAYALFWSGLWDECFELAERDPDDTDLLPFLAINAERAGDVGAAANMYERVLADAPGHRLSRQRLEAIR